MEIGKVSFGYLKALEQKTKDRREKRQTMKDIKQNTKNAWHKQQLNNGEYNTIKNRKTYEENRTQI